MILALRADQKVQPLVQTRFVERNAEISPDGRWMAYASDESGQVEIHVRPFPDANTGHWQVSTAGGSRPLGRGMARALPYDISPDGRRFLMIKAASGSQQTTTTSLVVVQNWTEGLKRLVPAK